MDELNRVLETITNLPGSDEDEMELLIELDMLPAISVSGDILTDNDGNIILRY